MSIIFLILPITLVLSAAAVAAFAWATRGGQFDDLETPARRMLHDATPSVRISLVPRAPEACSTPVVVPGDGKRMHDPHGAR